jgi:ABC-type multidrug transport system fused ATPase/permease subunit
MSSLIVIYLIKSIFLGLSAFIQSNFIFSLSAKASSNLFNLYLFQPYVYHLRRNSSEMIRIVSNDVSMLSSLTQSSFLILSEIFVISGALIILIIVEPLGAITTLFVFLIFSYVYHLSTRKKIEDWGVKNQFHGAKKYQHIQQGLSASKDVKLLGREEEFMKIYNYHNKKIAKINEMQTAFLTLPRLFIEMLSILLLCILVITMIITGKNVNEVLPVIILFAAAAFRLMPSINRILSAVQTFLYSLSSVETIYNELTNLEKFGKIYKKSNSVFSSSIVFQNVSFKYPGSDKGALKNISFEINKGESIGIIGASGSGKSTLIDNLLGLMIPNSGSIKVDGININEELRAWQDQIGYVPQTIYLTDDSIRRNIAFGIPDDEIIDKNIKNAIESAQLIDFINQLEHGLETEVGERGVRLSGGQRQRIGIARALYHNPKVLVLDEATSSLDNKTEKEVMSSINKLQGDKTLVIIAHRLSTIENCDRIIKINDGILEK